MTRSSHAPLAAARDLHLSRAGNECGPNAIVERIIEVSARIATRMVAKTSPVVRLLKMAGPGLITRAADDDPSGIATYSQAGAQFGYTLGWTMFLTAPFMIAIQLVSARIGAVTGQGVAANIGKALPRSALHFIVG